MADKTVPGMAEAVEARSRTLGLSPGAFAQRAGLTGEGLAPVRRGDRKEYAFKTRHGVARALRWPADWYDRLLAGDDPESFVDTDWPAERTTEERLDAVEVALADVLRRLDALGEQ